MPEKIPIAYDVKSMLLGSVSAGVLHHSKRPVLLGSVSGGVAHHSPAPVLVVPPDRPE